MTSHVCLCSNGAQKLLGVLITIGEAVAYVVSGMYGDVRELGAASAILIIVQVGSAVHCSSSASTDVDSTAVVHLTSWGFAAFLCWHHCHLPR